MQKAVPQSFFKAKEPRKKLCQKHFPPNKSSGSYAYHRFYSPVTFKYRLNVLPSRPKIQGTIWCAQLTSPPHVWNVKKIRPFIQQFVCAKKLTSFCFDCPFRIGHSDYPVCPQHETNDRLCCPGNEWRQLIDDVSGTCANLYQNQTWTRAGWAQNSEL